MGKQNQDSAQESVMYGEGKIVQEDQNQIDKKEISEEYFLEFISRHHLNRLWDEFVYEKNHPKTPLSATQVLALINMTPEEQEQFLKEHE